MRVFSDPYFHYTVAMLCNDLKHWLRLVNSLSICFDTASICCWISSLTMVLRQNSSRKGDKGGAWRHFGKYVVFQKLVVSSLAKFPNSISFIVPSFKILHFHHKIKSLSL